MRILKAYKDSLTNSMQEYRSLVCPVQIHSLVYIAICTQLDWPSVRPINFDNNNIGTHFLCTMLILLLLLLKGHSQTGFSVPITKSYYVGINY